MAILKNNLKFSLSIEQAGFIKRLNPNKDFSCKICFQLSCFQNSLSYINCIESLENCISWAQEKL